MLMKATCRKFKNKKIILLGLGILGRGVNVTKFLAECGAELLVTDLKTAEQLATALKELKKFKNITYRLGGHDLKDFQRGDMLIKAAGVPLDSPYVAEARKNNIPVEMDASLFAKLTEATLIGITGTRGKSTTTQLIYHLLKKSGKKVFLGGNVKGLATLPLLKKARRGDFVVLELDSWQLQGFGDSGISPHIAVFTNFLPDHQNYYGGSMARYFADKANIFKYQKTGDFFVTLAATSRTIKKYKGKALAQTLIAPPLAKSWILKIPGEHNRENAALAATVGRILKIPQAKVRAALASFSGVAGRLELIYDKKGTSIYNDTTSTTPDAAIAGIEALAENKNKKKFILITGGMDKGLDFAKLAKVIKQNVLPENLFLLAGSATVRIVAALVRIKYFQKMAPQVFDNLQDIVYTVGRAPKGKTVLFSPAAASFEKFKNEFDRGERFNNLIEEVFDARK
ncbi:MAG: UDP-N-acetylmuramoyl-L-alanine--D-glutamate ligase [Candidatus Niyogibacteria bacterium]|nr:UDP-N-acetylmuramoyl-L-alanine--D-glutamate ligase [Candidatus Niyogibacteria bacterium]